MSGNYKLIYICNELLFNNENEWIVGIYIRMKFFVYLIFWRRYLDILEKHKFVRYNKIGF